MKRFRNRHKDHFITRVKERYGIDVHIAMIRFWVRLIADGNAEHVSSRFDKKGRVSSVYKLMHENKPIYLVYRENDGRLITALPASKFPIDKPRVPMYTNIMNKIKELICLWFHNTAHEELSRLYNNLGKHRQVVCHKCTRTWEEHWL